MFLFSELLMMYSENNMFYHTSIGESGFSLEIEAGSLHLLKAANRNGWTAIVNFYW